MRKRDLALSFFAVAIATLVTLSAQATPLPPPAKAYSLVKEAGCRGPGTFCPAGLQWVCDLNRCGCARCVFGGPRPYWSGVRMPPNGRSSGSAAPPATVTHYIVLDEVGHCTVVDSKPSADATLKIVGDQNGYTSLESADKALKDFKADSGRGRSSGQVQGRPSKSTKKWGRDAHSGGHRGSKYRTDQTAERILKS